MNPETNKFEALKYPLSNALPDALPNILCVEEQLKRFEDLEERIRTLEQDVKTLKSIGGDAMGKCLEEKAMNKQEIQRQAEGFLGYFGGFPDRSSAEVFWTWAESFWGENAKTIRTRVLEIREEDGEVSFV